MAFEDHKVTLIIEDGLPPSALESLEEFKSKHHQISLSVIESYDKSRVPCAVILLSDVAVLLAKHNVLDVVLEKILVPKGKLKIVWTNGNEQNSNSLAKNLRLTGYVEVHVEKFQINAQKGNYEVGASVPLNFSKHLTPAPAASSAWKLDDDEDMIDDEALLDEDDLKKPDPESLRVCGTTGKRKACKDCSCGLAEELEQEGVNGVPREALPKSSCGSCYLGDAFRCAGCPYQGMPAFKPGEKVQLSDALLRPDA